MIGSMILTTRCAGCERPGAPLCRTCRFALVARAEAVGAARRARRRPVHRAGARRAARVQVPQPPGRRPPPRRLVVNRVAASGRRVDVVTWAPTGARRRHERGFDQAELVARHVARQLGVPCRRLLERRGPAGPQTGQDRRGRLHGPAFRAHPACPAGARPGRRRRRHDRRHARGRGVRRCARRARPRSRAPRWRRRRSPHARRRSGWPDRVRCCHVPGRMATAIADPAARSPPPSPVTGPPTVPYSTPPPRGAGAREPSRGR